MTPWSRAHRSSRNMLPHTIDCATVLIWRGSAFRGSPREPGSASNPRPRARYVGTICVQRRRRVVRLRPRPSSATRQEASSRSSAHSILGRLWLHSANVVVVGRRSGGKASTRKIPVSHAGSPSHDSHSRARSSDCTSRRRINISEVIRKGPWGPGFVCIP